MNRYASVLDEMIEKSGISLTELSNKCEEHGFKVTVSYLSKLRNGKMPPPSFKISAIIAKVLGEKPEKLLAAGLADNQYKNKKELKEAFEITFPDYSPEQIFERVHVLNVNPEYAVKDDIRFQSDLSEEEIKEMLDNAPDFLDNFDYIEKGKILTVPVLGSIPAGTPNFINEEFIEEYIQIPNSWNLKDGEVFVLRVKGDSMIGSRIYDGDKVLVKIQPDVENGEIAVVNVNGDDATLKRVKKINGQVILYPDNPKYQPIFIENENARIIGKVIQVMFEPK